MNYQYSLCKSNVDTFLNYNLNTTSTILNIDIIMIEICVKNNYFKL